MEEDTAMNGTGVMPDASMMDANMDDNMDDLFGEPVDGLTADPLGVGLPSAPLPPSLVLRVAEMQNRGCCTKLVWSNTGSIAQISDDGREVVFRAMIRNQKTGQWSLTEDSKHPILAPEGAKFEHVHFSGIGVDLAMADSLGGVHVYTLFGALGKMAAAPTNIRQNETSRGELDVVVGLHWLIMFPTEFKIPYISPANKHGDRWVTAMRHRDSSETTVHHAVDGRHALLYVSRDTKLTLMYQNEPIWYSVSVKLENITSSDEFLTHAAMGEEGDHLLLVTHDIAKQFRLYKITINWNPSQHTRPGGPTFTAVTPTLEIGHLTASENITAQQADTTRLSLLRLIPTIPPVADPPSLTYPTILAVFTRASLPTDPTMHHQEAFSVIARWHIESTIPTLHPSFTKLKPNGTTPVHAPVTVLRRQEDIITNKLVLSVEPQYYNTNLAFIASDGMIEFRERVTMTSIEPYGDTTTVSSLPQSGFEHAMTAEHSIHVAMSADGSALAYVKPGGNLASKMMALRSTWQPLEDGISDTSGLIEAAVVCLARQYAILSCSSSANDETLALIPNDLSLEMRTLFAKEIIKMTNRTLDISMLDASKQHMIVIKEPLLPRALSVQLVIGTQPNSMKRTTAGVFAFAFLNMRLLCTALAQVMSRPELFVRPDYINSLRGLITWGSDLLVYVAASLIPVERHWSRSVPGTSARRATDEHLLTTTSNPSLQLLICTFSRAYFRFLASCIPKYLAFVQKIIPTARSVLEKQQLAETYEQATHLPFKYAAFDAFIAEVDTAVRNAYTSGNIGGPRRSEIELATMCDGSIATELDSVLTSLLSSSLPKLIEVTDLGSLYFRNTTWLGLSPGNSGGNVNIFREAEANSAVGQYDIIRKLPLTKGMKVRACRRCGALMEDIPPERMRELPNWLAHAQRHCICANYWLSD